jgi:hypothetical protein
MPLKDNYFRVTSAYGTDGTDGFIAKVAEITLAVISTWTEEELERVGWTNNPIIDILYSMTSTGVWIANTDTNGNKKVYDSGNNSTHVLNGDRLIPILPPTFGVNLDSNAQLDNAQRRIGIEVITLVGGALANTELVPALAGYYGVLKIKSIISDSAIAPLTCTFQDEDDNALTGLMGGVAEVTLTANTVNTQLEDCILYKGTDNKALEVDLSGGGGVEVVTIQYEYWYET